MSSRIWEFDLRPSHTYCDCRDAYNTEPSLTAVNKTGFGFCEENSEWPGEGTYKARAIKLG